MIVNKVKKSRFIPYLYQIKQKQEVKDIITSLNKEHKKASHICYAYLIGDSNNQNGGYSDDKEPSGTVGKPLLNLLMMTKSYNQLIIVVRYYGGVKLGAGNLTRAYIQTAKMVFENDDSKN